MPMTAGPEPPGDSAGRRRAVVVAGHAGQETAARAAMVDPSPDVRGSALNALARMGSLRAEDISTALSDPAGEVRRRACEIAGRLGGTASLPGQLVLALADTSPSVVEAACYALGELGAGEHPGVVSALSSVARGHGDPLCREAAVAALGALGQADGLVAVLAALDDKAAVRRRAVIALAGFNDAFEADEVQAALQRALSDPDWQVRQGAEDVLGQRARPNGPGPARPA
ncbi:MAG: HEAT repeat domain-containing protein [Acidimicrobiales bacterium]